MQSNTTHLPSGDGTGAPTRFSVIISSKVNGRLGFWASADVASARRTARSVFMSRKTLAEELCVQALSLGSTGCQPVVRGSLPRTLWQTFRVWLHAFGKLPNATGWQPVLPRFRDVAILRFRDRRLSGAWCLGFDALVFAPMAQVTIETIKNGPYIVTGEVDLIDVALSLRGRNSYWCMESTAAGFIGWLGLSRRSDTDQG